MLMYTKIFDLNVPTWVIAPPEVTGRDAAAKILKTYSEREPICRLKPNGFNERLDRIIAAYC